MSKPSSDQVWVVMPAAGGSSRLAGDRPKQYREVNGEPLLLLALRRVAEHPRVAGVVVVLAPGDDRWPGLESCAGKPVLKALGGDQRHESVRAGLDALPAEVGDEDWVLVHDAARPCVRHADISRLLDSVWSHPVGGLLGVPVRDTLKSADADGCVTGTMARAGIWHAQTPQMFRRSALQHALAAAGAVTDEAAAMESTGHMPLVVRGSGDNIKITYNEDLAVAAYYLSCQEDE